MRFSSIRYATLACRSSAHQPATAITKSRTAATSTTAGVYISASGLVSEASAKKWDTTGTPHGYLSQSASQQQDEQDEQNKPAETPADSWATVVKPAAAEQQ